MKDNTEFDLESSWTESPPPRAGDSSVPSAATEPTRPADPVVVIQYRDRGISPILLLPITLIASLALFAGYHHFFVRPIFPHGGRYPAPSSSSFSLVANTNDLDADLARVAAALPVALPAPMPLTLESQPLHAGYNTPAAFPVASKPDGNVDGLAPATGSEAVAWPGPEPPKVAEAQPLPGPEKPAVPDKDERSRISIASTSPDSEAALPAEASPAPIPEAPAPTREEMMERIQQEAELRLAQQKELERRQREAVARHEAEAADRVEDERMQFRKALQDILAGEGRNTGKAIDDLCDKFGRNYSPELRNRVGAALAHYKGKLTRDGEIRMLRALGVPEPGILDYLSNRVHRSINSRNGPRDPDEVRIFAARQLLRMPLSVPSANSDARAQPPVRRSSFRRTTASAPLRNERGDR